MKKVKIGLVGACGRMGLEVAQVLKNSTKAELFLGVTREKPLESADISGVDVWIDFSTPETLSQLLKVAEQHKTPVVSGTTGLTDKEAVLLDRVGQQIPLLWASNMSVGVAVLNEALKVFSSISDFDFQIEEIHHKFKKDMPSGTALTLQKNLNAAIGKELPTPVCIRGGGVFGVHKVFALSEEEALVFEHTALNRSVFAKGAVNAALWLLRQSPGRYEIRNMLFGNKT